MSVREYSLKFMKLSKYALFIVVDPLERINKFIPSMLNIVSKDARLPHY